MYPTLAVIMLGVSFLAAEIPPVKTNIQPGSQAILAIPFEPQQRGGICAAAATINILKFLNPQLQISQEQLFSLFDAGRTGASPQQVIQGIATLGYTGTLVHIDAVDPEKLIAEIKSSLDAGRPLIAGSRNHAVVLFGYDNTVKDGVFYLWDQRQPKNRPPAGMPPGTTEMSQTKLMSRMKSFMFIKPNQQNPDENHP